MVVDNRFINRREFEFYFLTTSTLQILLRSILLFGIDVQRCTSELMYSIVFLLLNKLAI